MYTLYMYIYGMCTFSVSVHVHSVTLMHDAACGHMLAIELRCG